MLLQINRTFLNAFFRFSFFAKDGSSETRFCNVADTAPSGVTSGNELHNYIAQNNGHQMLNDTKTLGSAYDSFLQSAGVIS